MPLPPVLLAKLSKRGIITPKQKPEHIKKQDFKGLATCPNKSNIYHECNYWCETHWKGVPTPDTRYVRNMQKLLVKYPMPNNWTEVFDKGIGRYYYWNMENDLVSWLPPKHPKSIKCQSAAKLRENRLKMKEREERIEREKDHDKERDSDDDERSYRSKHSDRRDRDRDREREDRRHRREDRHRSKKSKKDEIDPMDPAAYSDVPQGTWSDGLESNKTRADSTASGVLYQQRPYPAPGEVLAANKEKSKKK
ncbi:polyglutamine-binding protein 1-like [Anoplophora glabripennis]|uniref:polyglutamine-binding protein 1 n=1 Tax=Anoplophora glabripennis TaxID=217634 RepID=UPI000873C391|nr:polyglutamine-binding protein 1 [Anoplophora glabripennis]XP_023312418.1 polyglutamine-binding protein 1-like [Anoplophora glabripennis]